MNPKRLKVTDSATKIEFYRNYRGCASKRPGDAMSNVMLVKLVWWS